MCVPFSCIVKSDLSVVAGATPAQQSHTQIAVAHGLPREASSANAYACVTIKPLKLNDWYSDIASWRLFLDGDLAPSWWAEHEPEIQGRVREAAEKWRARLLALTSLEVRSMDDLILMPREAAEIHVRGGTVTVLDGPANRIHLEQGVCHVYGGLANRIDMRGGILSGGSKHLSIVTMSAGLANLRGESQNDVRASGAQAVVNCCDYSRNTIFQDGGSVHLRHNSRNKVECRRGYTRTSDKSQNTVVLHAGFLVSEGYSQNTIQQLGGEIKCTEHSRNQVTDASGAQQLLLGAGAMADDKREEALWSSP